MARRTALLLVAIGCGAATLAWPAPSAVPAVTGTITTSGGVFGAETNGTLACVAFEPVASPGRGVSTTPAPAPASSP